MGAQGAGVRWWQDLLHRHPQVHAPEQTSARFFEEFCTRPMTDADVEAYRFERPDGTITGEWSLRYGYDFWTPRLLRRAAPEAKLLMLVRDPVERYRAGIAHQARNVASRKDQIASNDAIERGRYADQVDGLLAHFAAEQLLVLQYERCARDPQGEYDRMCAFLGLERFEVGPVEPPAVEGPEVWPQLRRAIVDSLAADAARMGAYVDLELWPDFAP